MNQVEVKSADVVRLILQFLKESNLMDSFTTLQRQSKITLNTVNTGQITEAIMQSKWDEVLTLMNFLMPSEDHAFNLYELIVDDLIEFDRFQAANFVMKQFLSQCLKNPQNYKERIMRLEYVISNPAQKAIYKKSVTEARKREVIKQLLWDVHEEVEGQRLLKLLAQSVKYQANQGSIKPNIRLSLFQGKQREVTIEQETVIKNIEKVVKYSDDAKVNSMTLSYSEEYLALGGIDGLIEIYSTADYSLHNGLKFQAEGNMLFHEHPVLILEFNPTDDMLLSVDSSGLGKIWNLTNGKLLRKVQSESNVSSACWGIDPSHIIMAGQHICLYGIRSCLVLKEYASSGSKSGGKESWNRLFASQNRVYAVSNAGDLKIFNYTTQEELVSISLNEPTVAVSPIYAAKGSTTISRLLIATPKKVHDFGTRGDDHRHHVIEGGELANWNCVGQFMYEFLKGQDGKYRLNVRSRADGKNVYYCAIEHPPTLICIQRLRNLMVTYDEAHLLNFWRQAI